LLLFAFVLLGCPKKTETPHPEASASGGDNASLLACVDEWLKSNRLDRYGHPQGTLYAGGTPLFDERTGQSVDRLAYVLKRQPEAERACRGR
jgi:hypothetical protein